MLRITLALLAVAALAATASAQRIIYSSPPPAEYYSSPWTRTQPLVYTSGASYRVNPVWYPSYDTGFGGPGYQFRGSPYNTGGYVGVGTYGGYGGGWYGGVGVGFYSGGYYGGRRR